jgi:hypothetical protein
MTVQLIASSRDSGALAELRKDLHRDGPAPTLADVAAHARVSLATASRVLNGNYGVSRETTALVNQSIAALGYVRHRNPPGESPRSAREDVAEQAAQIDAIQQRLTECEQLLAVYGKHLRQLLQDRPAQTTTSAPRPMRRSRGTAQPVQGRPG